MGEERLLALSSWLNQNQKAEPKAEPKPTPKPTPYR
jgi:hypothetical protein